MIKVAAIEICYTETDVAMAEAKWKEKQYDLIFKSDQVYADVSLYDRKNGEQKKITENFGGRQPVILVFHAG